MYNNCTARVAPEKLFHHSLPYFIKGDIAGEAMKAGFRKKAKSDNLKRYFTGSPCIYGHIAERLVSNGRCVICNLHINKKNYYNNQEKAILRAHVWRNNNIEQAKEKDREYYRINRFAISERKQKRYLIDRSSQLKWVKNNPEKCSAIYHNRRARIIKAEGFHAAEDIKAIFNKQNGKCANIACGVSIKGEIKLRSKIMRAYAIDHIYPLNPRNGDSPGTNWPENIQLLCPSCNNKKANKSPIQWKKDNAIAS